MTNSDLTNLDVGLHGRAPELRVVLRLFDDDLADQVQRHSGIAISRSVSFLAAPAFAAALMHAKRWPPSPSAPRCYSWLKIPIRA